MKILIATPAAGGQVRWEYANSLLTQAFLHPHRLANQESYNLGLYLQGGYSGLAKDRAIAASAALREGFDKIVFIDADQSWKWDQLKKLLDSPAPVVGGMVAMKKYPIQLNFHPTPENKRFFEADGGVATPEGVQRWRNYQNKEGGELGVNTWEEMEVSAIGTGFLSINCKVLGDMVEKKVVEPFYQLETIGGQQAKTKCWDFFGTGVHENVYFGEDYGFCIYAQRAGHKCYVHTGVSADHHGGHTYSVPPMESSIAGQQMVLPLTDACHK